ncbi:AbrB/MazE/SpoVT family DNA-binding domain-containing protein [Phormidium yuhuli AB48]|uniref:AbrB/MazE/SpoVT family DNA-binding domain-containing protein n=1 Tax=Phormidium yuhuli AB48 TaxID=2940671 RepID=A0ABY5AUD0_9CYAN|nr:AbrB/MazE/SpoVT family DNA-binding domain-containing protein [Phormidium yuhuli]USR92645.1 AbrB/MazE/SpoVT family DNA-binding domain-containing protein [Phormidium yuhuli AB48]
MEIAKVSETGQIIIPPEMRKLYSLEVGTEIILTDTGKGILIQPKPPFPPTTLNEVAGCLKYNGSPKTLEDMESAISQGIQEQWHDCS